MTLPAGGGGATIDDAATSTATTWSSNKISTEISAGGVGGGGGGSASIVNFHFYYAPQPTEDLISVLGTPSLTLFDGLDIGINAQSQKVTLPYRGTGNLNRNLMPEGKVLGRPGFSELPTKSLRQ